MGLSLLYGLPGRWPLALGKEVGQDSSLILADTRKLLNSTPWLGQQFILGLCLSDRNHPSDNFPTPPPPTHSTTSLSPRVHFYTHLGVLSQLPLCPETSDDMSACPSLLAFSPWQIKTKPKLQGKGGSITRQRRRLRFECLSRSLGRPGDRRERDEAIRFL